MFYDFVQCSPWQSFASCLYGAERAILDCLDKPDWVHDVLRGLLRRKLRVIELGGRCELDLVECGGGGGSSTVNVPLPPPVANNHAAARSSILKSAPSA